jgi:hypothetical protein
MVYFQSFNFLFGLQFLCCGNTGLFLHAAPNRKRAYEIGRREFPAPRHRDCSGQFHRIVSHLPNAILDLKERFTLHGSTRSAGKCANVYP